MRSIFAPLMPASRLTALAALSLAAVLLGCHRAQRDPGTVVVLIESSPGNLDPRQGTDAQSEHISALIFDALVKKDAQYNLQPWLATSWEQPDPLTWVFHLRDGIRFQDGRPLEAADVAWTIDSLIDPDLTANLPGGRLVSPKAGAFSHVARVEIRDRLTLIVHMNQPDAGLLFNLSDGLFGIVPRGTNSTFGSHPVGSGPYRFISQTQDKNVILERWDGAWSTGSTSHATDGPPEIRRVEFQVVPDTITSALELQKHSADAASNVLTPDMVYALGSGAGLQTTKGPGSNVWYLNFNTQDSALKDLRVRQAVALAIDRPAIVAALWRGDARIADSLLPPGHWARAEDADLAQYPHDPARAAALLGAAGYKPDRSGIRLRIELKISTEGLTRLLAAALQQQMRAAGIALTIRSAEFGTFYSDVTRGAFQIYALKWVGSNDDPDIFRYLYSSASFPPKGANRGHYVNARVDALLAEAAQETGDAETVRMRRRAEYIEVQKILAEELPTLLLWYPDNQVVHTALLNGMASNSDGNFDFLR